MIIFLVSVFWTYHFKPYSLLNSYYFGIVCKLHVGRSKAILIVFLLLVFTARFTTRDYRDLIKVVLLE